ncbi:MAG TPA: carbohydrate ABC transporter permease, partial [Galbitalea sp.]|nr:carbohydrate ABC transporter permease [Galbitalea sp.]
MTTPQISRLERDAGRRLDPIALGARGVAVLVLLAFAFFFGVPIVWLIIATGKSPHELLTAAPFALGNWNSFVANWNALFGFQQSAIVGWLGNSTLYAFAALVIVLVVSIPAGFALALTDFRFRRGLLVVTLVVMLIPNTALVLPIFLELNTVGLIGNALAVILPFSF